MGGSSPSTILYLRSSASRRRRSESQANLPVRQGVDLCVYTSTERGILDVASPRGHRHTGVGCDLGVEQGSLVHSPLSLEVQVQQLELPAELLLLGVHLVAVCLQAIGMCNRDCNRVHNK